VSCIHLFADTTETSQLSCAIKGCFYSTKRIVWYVLGPWLEITIATGCQRCGIHKNNGKWIGSFIIKCTVTLFVSSYRKLCWKMCIRLNPQKCVLSLICAFSKTQFIQIKLTHICSLRPRWSWWSLCMNTRQMKYTMCTWRHMLYQYRTT